ncbi:DUF262 domain-containing protein [Acinetobacter chinensis]|uniref:DUF262 domain-containing protein n=1 Tax=Acinetobacter chinensis TaxID=2004650 RepID=UPI002934FC4F|nr:DUF262 domain-containing protein [Acinetobacter chinensis]WOE40724.1 DUF262 domain-containing protein [Acinetobacter chinensis]
MKISEFNALIKPVERPIRNFHCGFNYLETWIAQEAEYNALGIDFNPDFQRGHVWTEQQQIHYLENVLRRIVDESGLTIRFNNPVWSDTEITGDLPEQTVCIDGLQRITAIRKFIKGELNVFGIKHDELPIRVILRDLRIVIQLYEFKNKKDLLQFYLDLNSGGTAHTEVELNRVRSLMDGNKDD